jgi:RNA polymerase sigma-70 factor, ECF subfamily
MNERDLPLADFSTQAGRPQPGNTMKQIDFSETDEKTWINQAQQGDDEAFTRLVEAYQKPVYNFCYRMLGEPEEAEESAQETFLRAYQHLMGYDPRRPFTTWLLSIAAHHCIDRLRRQRFISFSLDEDTGEEVWLADRNAPDPETETTRRLEGEHLQRLLQSLDPSYRSVLVLRYWQDASEVEIAQVLHLSIGAVKSRLHRGRRRLVKLWKEQSTHCTLRRIDEEPALKKKVLANIVPLAYANQKYPEKR